jgi:glucokinase
LRLVADIGGTNARFALCDEPTMPFSEGRLRASDFADLVSCVRAYLDGVKGKPTEAVLAVAGPVADDAVRLTNLGWTGSRQQLCREFGLARLAFLNDIEAFVSATPHLEEPDLRRIGGGCGRPRGPRVGVCAGTGLGVSLLVWGGRRWLAVATEGGHATFSPGDEVERELLGWLHRRFDHVSWERVVSGPGLANLHEGLAEIEGTPAERLAPEEIGCRARQDSDSLCARAVRRFSALYGSVCGNIALASGATGGVYLGGGMVGALGHAFVAGDFRERFEAKGRHRSYLEGIPTVQVLRSDPTLLAACRFDFDGEIRLP